MKVLIIDDDIDTLTSISFLLAIYGFTVETEPLWQNTFNKIKLFDPELILLDVNLRGEDGRNLCQQIKTTADCQHIHIILFSAHLSSKSDLKGSLADDFIGKPFEIKDLIEKINYRYSKN